MSKRSQEELRRLIEDAIREESDHESRGLRFLVDAVEVRGKPPERLVVSATLHFLPAGSPYCCGEPGCHLSFLYSEGLGVIESRVRRKMGLRQSVSIAFDERVDVLCHDGVVMAPR